MAGTPEVVVRITNQNDSFDLDALFQRLPSSYPQHHIRFTKDPNVTADVVVVFNYLKYDTWIRARDGFIFRWDKEPVVRTVCPKGFDRIFTHLEEDCSGRRITAPPPMDWWIKKTWDELSEMSPPQKNHLASMIASTKVAIRGHHVRNEFAEVVRREFPEIDLYGKGRPHELMDKWDGLAPYRYSLAIENTTKPDYWTEKIADCFLSFTVPIYFGATNLADYFPEESFVWLPLDDFDEAAKVLREELSEDRWEHRLPAVVEARRRLLEEYSLGSRIAAIVEQEREAILSARRVVKRVHGRRMWRGGWVRGASFQKNLRAQVGKLLPS
jgi:hypothetical protein